MVKDSSHGTVIFHIISDSRTADSSFVVMLYFPANLTSEGMK